MRLTSNLCIILCRKVRLRDVMHFIMVETDRNLMTPVRAGSLLTVWSGVMRSEEVESEYNFKFKIYGAVDGKYIPIYKI